MAYRRGGAIIPRSRFFTVASYMVFYPVWLVAFIVDFLLYRVSVKNRAILLRHFLHKKKAIIVSNHTTVFDPVKICAAVMPFSIYHTLLEETVLTPVLGTFIQLLGGIPMPSIRRGKDHFIADFSYALKKRPAIHVYPEGECTLLSGVVKKFHDGAFIAAMELGVPVIPIATVFTPPATILMLKNARPRATLYVLPPIDPAGFRSAKELSCYTRSLIQNEIIKHHGTNDYCKGAMKRIKGVN